MLSFFTGAMGLDLGLIRAGLDVRLGQELDPRAIGTIRENKHAVVPGDIRQLLDDDPRLTGFLKQAGVRRANLFAVVGGPPCQPFSTAGHRRGVDDERGLLVFDFLRAAKVLQPRFIVIENVKGVLSSPGFHGSTLLDDILARVEAMGYQTLWGLMDAAYYGVPQFRERLIIIGSRDAEAVFIPAPTHFPRHQDANYRWRTLRDAIGDLEDTISEGARFSPRVQEILRLVPEGGNWRSLPPDIARQAMGGAWESGGGKVGFFRRLSFAEPSPTLVTSPVQKATMLAHPTRLRPLSVREYARIQGFPDDWAFNGTTTDKYKQIGNAVPVQLGQAIGLMLRSVAEGKATIVTKRQRGTSVHRQAGEIIGRSEAVA